MTEPVAPPASPETSAAPWERYRRPFVRDLAFVLSCPDVITRWLDFAPHQNNHQVYVHDADFWQAQYAAYAPRLQEMDDSSAYQTLTRYLMSLPSPSRLGFHFEGLIAFWLTDSYRLGLHPYEMLASNVQLYRGKQTIGELDLLLRNHATDEVEHWELAIKLFMGSAPFAPENWVGINSKDNLERKMTHMQTKQFRSVWVDTKDDGQVKIDKRFGIVKGHFFVPHECDDFVRPEWMTADFPLHRWYDRDDTDALMALEASHLRRARYVEWFTKRPFYEARGEPIDMSDMPLRSGLYFYDGAPMVVHRHYQAREADKNGNTTSE